MVLPHQDHCLSESHVHRKGGRAETDHLEQEQTYFVEGLPNSIKLPCGAPLFRSIEESLVGALSWHPFRQQHQYSWFVCLFFVVHLRTVFYNGHQGSLHCFKREGLDQVEFTKVEK